MDPTNNQPLQPPQAPNPDQAPQVITPLQQVSSGDLQQGPGAANNAPQQMPGTVMGSVQGSAMSPATSSPQDWQQPQPSAQPQGTMPSSGGSKKKVLLIVAVVLVVLALAGGAYFVLSKSSDTPSATKVAQQSSQSASAETKDMSTLQNLAFVAPADMSAFTPKSVTGGKNIYATKDSTDAKTCALSFGIYSAAELPGADINEILKPQLDNLKKTGVTIQGPTAGEPLVVKDAGGTRYSMPSLTFDMTKGTQHETDHYSIAVLGNGQRAVVQRTCANKNGAVDPAAFDVLEATAKNVTITAQ